MALSFARGAIQWQAADTAGTTYTVSGLSFQPKALMFVTMGIGSSTDSANNTVDPQINGGFAVSTTSRAVIHGSNNNADGTARDQMAYRNDAIAAQSASGDTDTTGELDLSAINSDGFVLTVDDQGLQNLTVMWFAWGGDDITNAEIFEITEAAATGNQEINLSGAFQPDVVLVFGSQRTATANSFSGTDDLGFSFGVATAASTGFVALINDDDASGTMDTDRYIRGGELLAQILIGGGNPNTRASLSSFDADGLTLNYAATANLGRRAIGLAIKGGQWASGGYTIAGNTGSATATVSGLAFQPIGGIGATVDLAQSAAGTSSTQAKLSIGGWTSTSDRGALGVWSENATANVEVDHVVEYDSFLALPSNAGALASSFDINAVNSDGFQVIVDTAGGVASEYHGYLVFASEAADTTDDLLADDIQSTSSVSSPVIGQTHVLNASDVQSTSETSSPALHQVHGLSADDVQSTSSVSAPALGISHLLSADDVESASSVSAPVIGQVHALAADDVSSTSSVSAPALGQVHALLADDVQSSSEVSAPALGIAGGTDALSADDIESSSEVSAPVLGQVHALSADDVESASEVGSPTLVSGVVEVAPAVTGGGADRRRRRKKRVKVYWEDLPDKPKPAPVVAVEAVAQEPEKPSRTSIDVPELLELGREIRLAVNDELEADDEDVFALVALL